MRALSPTSSAKEGPRIRFVWRPSFLALLALLLWPACAGSQTLVLDAFDLDREGGEQFRLSRALAEVSGLVLDPGGRLFAHNDERAVIYELDPATGETLKAFSAGLGGAPGDFEGIAFFRDRFLLSTSTGEILVTAEGSDGSAMDYRFLSTDLVGRCEFEGLALEPASQMLLLPCKKPKNRDLRKHIVVFALDPETMKAQSVPKIFLPLEALEDLDLKDSFAPSGIEVHPDTGHLLLISGQDEVILEFGAEGGLLGGRRLNKERHPQPEGISFGPDGSLLLADEGQGKRGRLTRYLPGRGGEGVPR